MAQTIEHVVRWWLTEPASTDSRDRFRATVSTIGELPGITQLRIGVPVSVTWNGPDQSWDLGFIVTFDSYDAVTRYMAHPAHQGIVDLARELASRVDVFYLDA
jgi:hypothetical protein